MDNLAQAKVELDRSIDEFSIQQDCKKLTDNTLYQLYVTKGKSDCCIDQCPQQDYSKVLGNLAEAKVKLDYCIHEFSVQQDYKKLMDNLVEAKEELEHCILTKDLIFS